MPETYSDPQTFIAVDLNGATRPLVCLWPSGETTIATIHDLCREIRDRDQIDGAVPAAVYVRDGEKLAEVTLRVDEDSNLAMVTVTVTRNGPSGVVTVASGWYDS